MHHDAAGSSTAPSHRPLLADLEKFPWHPAIAQGQPGPRDEPGPQGSQGPPGPSALRLDFEGSSEPRTESTWTLHELTIIAQCRADDGGPAAITLGVNSSVPATIQYFGFSVRGTTEVLRSGPPEPDLAPGVNKHLFTLIAEKGVVHLKGIQITYRNADRVISAPVRMHADGTANSCQLHGTAVAAG